MKVENLKDLQKVIQLCRKNGVSAIELDGIKMNIESMPIKSKTLTDIANDFPEASIKVPAYNGEAVGGIIRGAVGYGSTAKAVADKIATDELTEEQLMFYSARQETPGQDETQQ